MDEDEEYTYRESKKDRRLRNKLRMIERGRRHFKQNNHWIFGQNQGRHFREQAEMYGRKYHDYLQVCSCDMCGNPRHSKWNSSKYKLTMQERRALAKANEQFSEYGMSNLKRKS